MLNSAQNAEFSMGCLSAEFRTTTHQQLDNDGKDYNNYYKYNTLHYMMSIFNSIPCTVLFMYVLWDEEERRLERRNWAQKHLNMEGRRRRDRRYPRIAIRFYSDSPFKYLYEAGNDQALLNACGVDHKEFEKLLQVFVPFYEKYTFDEKTGVISEETLHPKRSPKINRCHWMSRSCSILVPNERIS